MVARVLGLERQAPSLRFLASVSTDEPVAGRREQVTLVWAQITGGQRSLGAEDFAP